MIDVAAVKRTTVDGLGEAVHRNRRFSREGILERLFTFAFRGLVYPQIWEDPAIDMEALALGPEDRVVAIASGGCNVLSYLTAGPARITAVDLNGAHIALNRLKLCAAKNLPDRAAFYRFFGRADAAENVEAYDRYLRDRLDPESRAYWEARTIGGAGRRRISVFARNFYRHGLLGHFIGLAHLVARAYGTDPKVIIKARDMAEQRAIFDAELSPLFDRAFVRWLVGQKASLYGLGIPPKQYEALGGNQPGGMTQVLRERLERLACGFDLRDNYFAWQAFGRGYGKTESAPVPPYLQAAHFDAVRARADRVQLHHGSIIRFLEENPDQSLDAYVLLDAQDWMNDETLTSLWTQILRTARPGARVIFRTAADERLLPGRIPDGILAPWRYDAAQCRAWTDRDRSSIYGGFHLYTLDAAA
jgi:S-adenosylmethionine-diacylglycerol 3-amino-3-carboxypropyl transferase